MVNPSAHGVEPGAAGSLTELIAEHGLSLDLVSPDPDTLERAITAAVDAGPDLMVVLAGDGTARQAARLCGPDGPMLAVLPGGTLNVLSRALGGNRPWRETLQDLLENGRERMLSGGRVAGRPFYVAAVLGSAALWAPVREAVRGKDLRTAWRRGRLAAARAFAAHLRFESDMQPLSRTTGLGLICPVVSRALNDQAPALEAALLDQRGVADVFRLGVFHLLGDWRADPKVITTLCRNGRAWARRPIPAILDGESFRLERSVEIEFVPEAYRALVLPSIP
ncbi:MAG TPA: diacylglycerol kinase family protein [Caulobacteraceae bacterium]|nr:diacylglycerol kinase family protein [Caulobacteraceae bacterium]